MNENNARNPCMVFHPGEFNAVLHKTSLILDLSPDFRRLICSDGLSDAQICEPDRGKMQSVYRGSVKFIFRSKWPFLIWQQVMDPLSGYYQLLIVFSICSYRV